MGRKATGQTTKMTRIPSRFEEQVRDFVNKLKIEEETGKTWTKSQSATNIFRLIDEIDVIDVEIGEKTEELNKKVKELREELKRMNFRPLKM